VHLLARRVKQDITDSLANRGSARFPGQNAGQTFPLQGRARISACVDLPEPSTPSNVINAPRMPDPAPQPPLHATLSVMRHASGAVRYLSFFPYFRIKARVRSGIRHPGTEPAGS